MKNLVALDPQVHRDIRINPHTIEAKWAKLNMVPVVLSEFSKLVVQFPIVFSKNIETGQFVCVALTGFEKGQNLFWENGSSTSIYTPLHITHLPFYVGQDEQSNNNSVICIDTQSSALSEQGEALFDVEGNATPYLKSAQSHLQALVEGTPQTETFISLLLKYKLLTQITLDITFGNGTKNTIKGLYSVDEERMEKLSESQIIELQQSGYLQLIHIQLASLGQIYALINKKNKMDLIE